MRMNAGADSISCLQRTRAKASDFLELTKPRLTSLVLLTTLAGFYAGCHGAISFPRLLHTLVGTALMAGGAGAFNMYTERKQDSLMKRTAGRPLSTGRMRSRHALLFALGISIAGFAYLFICVNPLTSLLSAIIFISYLFLYTPLKAKTWLSMLAGAVPGALPIVMGWTGARGELSVGAGTLFLIVFLWQLPHFYAIGWMHREDYARARFLVLSGIDPDGRRTSRQIVISLSILLFCTFLPFVLKLAGPAYLAGALALGIAFLAYGLHFSRLRDHSSARRLFTASAVYLPALLILMMMDIIRLG